MIGKPLILLLLALPALAPSVRAQDAHSHDTDRFWLLPDHMVSQFAGNIGLLSAGIGYSYAKDKMQADFLYGFVPAFEARTTLHILTAKTAWRPYRIDLNEDYVLVPLRVGTGFSYSLGRQFFTTLPDRYPSGYYWFATSFRFTPYVGMAVSKRLNESRTTFKRLELYGDLGTTDLHLVSYALNVKTLKPWDIVNLAIGVKMVF